MAALDADRRFLLKGSLINFLGTALKIIAPLLTIVVARFFGAGPFGLYVSTQFWVAMMSRVAVLGLDKGLTWYVPQNRISGRPVHSGIAESLWVSVPLAILMALMISGGSFLGLQKLFSGLKDLSAVEMTLYIASVVPWTFLNVFAGASDGNRKPQFRIFINDFAIYTISPMIALGLLWAGHPRYALPTGLLVANILGVFIYLYFIRAQFPSISWHPGRVSRALFKYSLPLGFSEFIVSFLLRTDLWMVLAVLGPKSAGVYAIMVTISNGIRTISLSFNSVLLPVVAGMDAARLKTDLKHVYSYCVSMTSLIQLGIGFFIVLFPRETLMIAGKSFVDHPEVLGVLLLSNLINGMFGQAGTVLNGLGKSHFLLKMNIVSLFVALGLNYALVPRIGILGAGLSTLTVKVLQNVWMNVCMVKEGFWPYEKYLWLQGIWILGLMGLYLALSTVLTLGYPAKIAIFAVNVIAIAITLFRQDFFGRKKISV